MSKINNAISQIHELDEMSMQNTAIHQIHPLVKLLLTIFYTLSVISTGKYNIVGILLWFLYPILVFSLSKINIRIFFHKIRFLIPLFLAVGIWNPLYDRVVFAHLGPVLITGGILSMITLMLKGILTLMASYLLMANTGIERICYALKLLHVPDLIVTQILLVYRYLILLLEEANAIFEAYSLRAPKEKGVKFRVWGPLIGQLLLRSLDRASNLYDGMLLRGFKGEYYYAKKQKLNKRDMTYLCLWCFVFVLLRSTN